PALRSLPKLATLELDETKVTDRGLKTIAEMKSLTSLSLERCPGISLEGLCALTKALPNCRINPEAVAIVDAMFDSARDDMKGADYKGALSICERIIKALATTNNTESNMRLFKALSLAGRMNALLGRSDTAQQYYDRAYKLLPKLPWKSHL